MKYKFVINPIPLTRKKILFLIFLGKKLAEQKIDFSYEYTAKEKTARQIARNAAISGYDVVVACGGDGTLMEVVNGIYRTKSALGILPLGTSNDFAKHLGISKFKKAAQALIDGKRKKIDLGMARFISGGRKRSMLFCSTSGIGFDAHLLKLSNGSVMNRIKKIFGGFAYTLCGIFMLFSYKSPNMTIKLNGKNMKMKLFILNANFVRSMGGINATPNADVDKGFFDVFAVEETSILKKLIGMAWYSCTSRQLRFREIHHIHKIKSFSVKSKIAVGVQLNGDIIGFTPAEFRILPKSMELLA